MNTYPRESVEFAEVVVTLDGAPAVSGVQYAITRGAARPTAWTAPAEVEGKRGVMISGLAVGHYYVWAKVTSVPEIPVINCGPFLIT